MIDDPTSTASHRFRVGLRTLFVLVTVAAMAIPCAWTGYWLKWIRQRHEFLDAHALRAYEIAEIQFQNKLPPVELPAPGYLWLFGEKGYYIIVLRPIDGESLAEKMQRRQEADRLFPEAWISIGWPKPFKGC